MIAQRKATRRSKQKSAAQHTYDTVSYVLDDRGKHAGRIARVWKSDAFLHMRPDPKLTLIEMLDITRINKRCRNPVVHYVLSWSKEEHPTPEQKEMAIRRIVHDLECDELAWLAVEHSGTEYEHVHLVINRVHPLEARLKRLGLDIKKAMKTVASINAEMGWKHMPGGSYEIVDGEVRHAQGSPDKVRVRGGSLNTERWNDIEAPERVIERAWNAAKSASSWQIFHRTIAEYGLSYTPYRKGRANGAIWELQRIKDDGTVLKEHRKASVIPNASWMKMLKKLGEYEEPSLEAKEALALQPVGESPHRKAVRAAAAAREAVERRKLQEQQEAERRQKEKEAAAEARRRERERQRALREAVMTRRREQEQEARRRREQELEATRRREQELRQTLERYATEIGALRTEVQAETEKRRPSSEALSACLRKLDKFERKWRGTPAWQNDEAHPSAGSTEFEFTKGLAQEWLEITQKEERRKAAIRASRASTPAQTAPKKDRKSTRLNSSHPVISYAVFCLKKKRKAHV